VYHKGDKMKKIFDYIDYRQYLRDYYEGRKKSVSHFTHRAFAKIAGLSSPVFLKLVMDGKSNLSDASIASLITALDLSPLEADYFRALVRFNQEKTFQKKREWFEQLRSIGSGMNAKVLEADQYDFYHKWYNSVLREIAPNCGPKSGFAAMGKIVLPPVKAHDVKRSIGLLKRIGLLVENADGSYAQTEQIITTGTEVTSLAVRDLHMQMSRLATRAIELVPKNERDISGLTIGISSATFDGIKKELEIVRSRILSMVSADKEADRVFRLNLQLFPLSKKVLSKGEKQL
jgi:uncharacterized protein (TIGR02147 family)